MKFIHTGDFHIGASPDAGKPWSKARAEDISESAAAVIQAASAENADLLLIAGDFFHTQPAAEDLKKAADLFSSVPGTKIALIAGDSDCLRESSAALSFRWPDNVHFFTEQTVSAFCFPELGTEVYGISCHRPVIREDPLSGFRATENDRIHILLMHGGDESLLPVTDEELMAAGFSYCALAHDHRPHIRIPGLAACCGSPEPLGASETGQHGYYRGEIDDTSRTLTDLTFVPSAKIRCISFLVNVTPETTNAELLSDIENRMKERGPEHIYTIRIRGKRDPSCVFDLKELKDRFRIAGVVDTSEPAYDFPRLFAEHSSDMIGFFIRELNRPNAAPIERKALAFGVDALLRTQEERSGTE